MSCVDCGREFTPQKRQPGLKGQCPDCGRDTEHARGVNRYVGLQGSSGGGNKGNGAVIFRNAAPSVKALVVSINKGRFSANTGLGIGSTASVQKERPGD